MISVLLGDPVLLENPVGPAAFLKSPMFTTRDVKNAPPYQYTSLVVCGGNISSGKRGLGTAIMAGLPPPPWRSLLSSCRVRMSEKAGVPKGQQWRQGQDGDQQNSVFMLSSLQVLAHAFNGTSLHSPNLPTPLPSETPSLLLHECCLESIREKKSTPNIMWERPLVRVAPLTD